MTIVTWYKNLLLFLLLYVGCEGGFVHFLCARGLILKHAGFYDSCEGYEVCTVKKIANLISEDLNCLKFWCAVCICNLKLH